jgi:hypothetical protein
MANYHVDMILVWMLPISQRKSSKMGIFQRNLLKMGVYERPADVNGLEMETEGFEKNTMGD